MFSELGFYYVGPIDGHDVENLVQIFENVKNSKHKGPVLIHVRTQKGKGYKPAEASGDKYHGVSKFNVSTGEQSKQKSNTPSYTKVFAETLIKHAEQDTKIVGITGAMPSGTGLNFLKKSFLKELLMWELQSNMQLHLQQDWRQRVINHTLQFILHFYKEHTIK